MSENKTTVLTLGGAVRLKARNTPEYFNNFSKEAYSLFDSPEAIEMMGKILVQTSRKEKMTLYPEFAENSRKMAEKFALTTGTYLKFLNGEITFSLDEKVTILNDIIAEITIQDGIVTKIEKVPYPYLA